MEETELTRRVDAIMASVPVRKAFSQWCRADACFCSGCVNKGGGVEGRITEGMWLDWKRRHDRRLGSDRRGSGQRWIDHFDNIPLTRARQVIIDPICPPRDDRPE